jgi:tetraacyldisaccharide 4'-kinase
MRLLAPKFWQDKNILSFAMLPLALIYFIVISIKNLLKLPYKSKLPVVCIGNVTAGGGGKTPIAIWLAKYLTSKQVRVCFLSRGYGGNYSNSLKLDPAIHDSKFAGDEALLLAKYAPVYLCKNRAEGAKLAEKDHMKMIIMDDGMQNNSIIKDITLMAIDGETGFGNGLLLPAGPLREPASAAIKKSNMAIIIGQDKQNLANIIPSVAAKIVANNNQLEGKKILAFAGIARPQKFYHTLEELGAKIIFSQDFPDHYFYSNHDLDNLCHLAEQNEAMLITTEKDYIKIPASYKDKISYLPIAIEIENKQKITDIIDQLLK